MLSRIQSLLPALLAALALNVANAAPPPVEAFARMPMIRNVALSPDGKRILYIAGKDDFDVLVTLPAEFDGPSQFVTRSDPGQWDLKWCGWANNERILCGVGGVERYNGVLFPISRLIAVNADGSKLKVLIQNSDAGAAQFHDRILDWTPAEPDSVLIQLDANFTGYPTVFELNVNNGSRAIRVRDYHPIRSFSTDGAGNVRLGRGYTANSTTLQYFARLDNTKKWLPLTKVEAFKNAGELTPLAVIPGTNRAFASGYYQGREALWEMDMSDQSDPKLVFSHPLVDAADPLLTPDGKLIGISYETDRPFVYYTDEQTRAAIAAINQALPSTFNYISDYSADRQSYIVAAYSDVQSPTYYLLRPNTNNLERIGYAYPELDPKTLGRMQTIAYKARDGVEIPGYLTAPHGVRAEKLPLIVMPHGGPIARDSWDFDFLRAFLVSRGYAVLQMNFRGSSGYGGDWYSSAHQDWGGLTYNDITDGTRWAIEKGIADPQRVCIVGWSFGGYAALLSAVRDNELYRCSASIAGVSDLRDLLRDASYSTSSAFTREQIGTNREKLRLDSPVLHAAKINMPVFMIHGDRDWQVDVSHSRDMASALKKAGKPHQAFFLKGASHQLRRQTDRMLLLTELEKFLAQHLGAGTAPGP
ncbi:alpha/beta hydrolase family protein [Steroidobacter sp.]|uniref:alpha/beta hydrolase family protein n=1 Tax=Steroidobacter sp. TaxID=1978227 RepID=UPI001A4450F4|nr:S9 family peptidase [Steroidobacter sp.]MBL8271712.1 S9 family peptidase [Steroidobacter sp.]